MMRNDLDLFRSHGIDPQTAVYPGHPVALAFCIVHAFATYEEAFVQTEHNWAAALGDIRIPGAGGNIADALSVLRYLKRGMDFVQAMAIADDFWARCDGQKQGGYRSTTDEEFRRFHKRWDDGQVQANLIKPLLETKKDWWA